MSASLQEHLSSRANEFADACTRCGKCVEVCPVIPYIGPASASAEHIAGNVVQFLGGQTPLMEESSAWLHACNGCGECIPKCPVSINPRQMLLLASIKQSAHEPRSPQLFRRMSRAIRLMTAMQLVPKEFERVFVPPAPRKVAAVFYLGCNALRTPHLLFNTMYILDALEVDYEVVGGPSACCGTIHTKWHGDLRTGGRLTLATVSRFEGFTPERVLNWCPSCQLHLGEAVEGFARASFDFDHVTAYLVTKLEQLQRRFVKPIRKRVVLHAHQGFPEIGDNVARLLGAIPELELLETVRESSYTCGGAGCSKCPELQKVEHAALLSRVEETQADMLVTLYHGCHMAFVGEAKHRKFDVVNFTDLLAEALGAVPHADVVKHWQLLDDWRLIATESQSYLRANGLSLDPDWVERQLYDLLTASEFTGGQGCAPYSQGSDAGTPLP